MALLPWLSLALLSAAVPCAHAGPDAAPEERAAAVGQPVSISVAPAAVALDGPLGAGQLVVTGQYADGKPRDLTPFCEFRAEDAAVAAVEPTGIVWARGDGQTALTVAVGGQTARVPVTVTGVARPDPVSFRHDVIAALSVGGCNSGACHGTPSGKNGFRLSLRGYLPDQDYVQLTRDIHGRRTNRLSPESSLIYLKALGRVPHEGGVRFGEDTLAAKTLRAWLAEGLRDDPADLSPVVRIEIVPGSRVLDAPARRQQLAVLAHHADGTVRDVTRLTVFETSEKDIAGVTPQGLVEFAKSGEVAVLCRYLQNMQSIRLAYLEPKEGFSWPDPPAANYVDRHVFAKLQMLDIRPSELCSDEEFIRRACLDLCAVLPTPAEVREFLADNSPDKRARLVDRLLARPEYADFWTLKWLDVLRSKRSDLGEPGAKAYQAWLRGHVERNTPLDRVVRELLTAGGNTFESGPANYYRVTRTPEELAETTAQLFLGVRMQCAKCHNHPFERWTQDDYYSTAAFFARVKRDEAGDKKQKPRPEVISADGNGEVRHLRTGQVMAPSFLSGKAPEIGKGQDRREVFARWLTAKDNPFFARSVVNRVWFHLVGRGIVDPVDDFRDSNPPANDELLDALAKDFVEHDFDIKHVIRTVMNSRTYQLSALTNEFNRDDDKYFSHAVTRLLTAEQLLDAICQVTEVPENFQGFPRGTRATQLPDGEVNNQFLKAFGQPARELPCECERGGEATLAQALQLINGETVHRKLTEGNNRLGRLLREKKSDREIVEELYAAALSRAPREGEIRAVTQYVAGIEDRRKAWEDVLWTIFNTKEFMFRH